MSELKKELAEKKLDSYESRKFRTMADGRNFIEKTNIYTSNLKDKDKEYVGRGSKAGFFCSDKLYNQFIDLSKTDGKWHNQFIGNDTRFLEIWKDSTKSEEMNEWMEGKKGMIIRLFVKDGSEPFYVGKGIYYYSGHSENGILWTKY